MEMIQSVNLLWGGREGKSVAATEFPPVVTSNELFRTEEGREEGGETSRIVPSKRTVALSAFLACLSFIVIAINLLISFGNDLVQNDKMWNWLSRNYTACTY
jgi:hypothetical protein